MRRKIPRKASAGGRETRMRAITERCAAGLLTVAQCGGFGFGKSEFHGSEAGPLMGAVTKRLGLRPSAGAPPIVARLQRQDRGFPVVDHSFAHRGTLPGQTYLPNPFPRHRMEPAERQHTFRPDEKRWQGALHGQSENSKANLSVALFPRGDSLRARIATPWKSTLFALLWPTHSAFYR